MIKLTKTPILPNFQVPDGFFLYKVKTLWEGHKIWKKIFHLFWQNRWFYSVESKQTGHFGVKFLCPFLEKLDLMVSFTIQELKFFKIAQLFCVSQIHKFRERKFERSSFLQNPRLSAKWETRTEVWIQGKRTKQICRTPFRGHRFTRPYHHFRLPQPLNKGK